MLTPLFYIIVQPGESGISLTTDQWNKLKSHIDEVDEAIEDIVDEAMLQNEVQVIDDLYPYGIH